jgi:hypothetical protein
MFRYPFEFSDVGLYSHCCCIGDFIKATLSLGDHSGSDELICEPEQDCDEVWGECVDTPCPCPYRVFVPHFSVA